MLLTYLPVPRFKRQLSQGQHRGFVFRIGVEGLLIIFPCLLVAIAEIRASVMIGNLNTNIGQAGMLSLGKLGFVTFEMLRQDQLLCRSGTEDTREGFWRIVESAMNTTPQ